MARDTLEVLIGPGTLYVGDEGTAMPADPTAAPDAAFEDIGYSEEGWSFNVDRTTEDIEVAEEIDPIDLLQTAREVHLVGTAVQSSLVNLQTALGGGTITAVVGPPDYDHYEPDSTDVLVRKALLLRTKAPNGKVRDIQMKHSVSVGAVEMASRKAPDKSQLAMDFRALKVTPDRPFEIKDET